MPQNRGDGGLFALRPDAHFTMPKIALLIVAVVLVGCSDSDQPPTYPVSGTVSFRDGSPVKDVTVKFRTVDQTPPFTASGKTDDQGKFQFSAAEGKNLAMLVPFFPRDTDDLTPAQRDRVMNPLDPRFLDYEKSQLSFEVSSDPASNQFDITVWPPRR